MKVDLDELKRDVRAREWELLKSLSSADSFQARVAVREEMAFLSDVDEALCELDSAWGDLDHYRLAEEEGYSAEFTKRLLEDARKHHAASCSLLSGDSTGYCNCVETDIEPLKATVAV